MKKLLALVLCVMMFVSVMSTSAFAAYDTTDQRVWAGASQQKKIVEALRTNVENMYGSYAVDNAVYNSVKTIDDIIKDLVDEALKDYGSNAFSPTSGTTINDAIVAGLRSTIGGQITDYLQKHQNDFYRFDSLGNRVFNPSAYAGAFAKAASEALTSEKAAAGIQAYMLYAIQRSAFSKLALEADALRSDIIGWEHWGDYGWDDTSRSILRWHVPGTDTDGTNNLDGVLHRLTGAYDAALSALGQLGVDLNDDGYFNLGFGGPVLTVDGGLVRSTVDTNERVNSALLRNLYMDLNGDGKIDTTKTDERTAIVYENTTGTYYADTNGDKIVDSVDFIPTLADLDGDGVADDIDYANSNTYHGVNDNNSNETPFFWYEGKDTAGNWIDAQYGVGYGMEAAAEVNDSITGFTNGGIGADWYNYD
jgi:hypothetical protein